MANKRSNMKCHAHFQDGVASLFDDLNLSEQQSEPEELTGQPEKASSLESTVLHCQRQTLSEDNERPTSLRVEPVLSPSAGTELESCVAGEESNTIVGREELHFRRPEPVHTDQGSENTGYDYEETWQGYDFEIESTVAEHESRSSGIAESRLDRLASSSSEGRPLDVSSSNSDKCMALSNAVDVDMSSGRLVPTVHTPVAEVSNFNMTVKDLKSRPGFNFVPTNVLLEFLMQIVTFAPGIGIIHETDAVLVPLYKDGVWHYREEIEYWVMDKSHGSKDSKYGVYICVDRSSNKTFVIKKIKAPLQYPLTGIAFTIQHYEKFMPKLYAIFKESDCVSIFQEHIKGGTLMECDWNLEKVHALCVTMLSAFEYFHDRGLVHYDVKLTNLMVRDRTDPSSLVVIDFESAKHPDFKQFHTGGYTLIYLPPWHDEILCLKSYDQKLKSTDMWGIACVVIFFLLPSDRHDLRMLGLGDVWSQDMDKIRRGCEIPLCRERTMCCQTCKDKFKTHLRDHGSKILHVHLPRHYNDDSWKALYGTLQYLTSATDIHKKHIRKAINILKGCQTQPSDDTDFHTNARK